jgi:hypothetical protein
MLEKHGIACDLMHGFNWDKWTRGKPTERLQLIPAGQEHILEQEDGKKRWVQVVTELSRAFALCAASDEATAIRDDVSFFQALQAALNKQSSTNRKTPEQIDAVITAPITNTTKVTTLTAATGLFAGSFQINGATTALHRPAPFFGQIVKIGATTEGYGYFLLPTATAKITTSPKLSGRVVLGVP